jgi:hypothetical protein
MGTNNTGNKTAKATRVSSILAGMGKRFPNGAQALTLDGTPTTVATVNGQLQGFLNAHAAVLSAHQNVQAMVAAENALLDALDGLLLGLVAFLRGQFGKDPVALGDFGLKPAKARAPRTAEQKAAAAAKAKATRAARGTTSKKAKEAIKGNVTVALTVTPAAAPTEPTAPTAPATTATAPKS